jgi:hypothetical protein
MGISLSKGNAKLVKTSGVEYKVIGFGLPADHNFTSNRKHLPRCHRLPLGVLRQAGEVYDAECYGGETG